MTTFNAITSPATQAAKNLPITWNTRGNGDANDTIIFNLTSAPCDSPETFAQWLISNAASVPGLSLAISSAVILAIKPSCQRIAKDSNNKAMTADFMEILNALIHGTPTRSKYLPESEALALSDVLMPYWLNDPANLNKPAATQAIARTLLIAALTNKTAKGITPGILPKVREAWETRLIAANVEVPPALIPVVADTITADAF